MKLFYAFLLVLVAQLELQSAPAKLEARALSAEHSFEGVVYDPGFRGAAASLEAQIADQTKISPSLRALRLSLRLDEFVIQARRYRVIVHSWSPQLVSRLELLLNDTKAAMEGLKPFISVREFSELSAQVRQARLILLGQ